MGVSLEPLTMVPMHAYLPPTTEVRKFPTSAHRTGDMVSSSDSTHAIQSGHVLVQRRQFALCYWRSYDGGYHLKVLGHETGKRQRRQE